MTLMTVRKPCLLSECDQPIGQQCPGFSAFVLSSDQKFNLSHMCRMGVQASERAFCLLTPCVLDLMMLRDAHMTTSSR